MKQEDVTLTVLHSLLFQLIWQSDILRRVLAHNYEENYRQLISSQTFVRDLIKDILVDLPTFFIVDGLDEINIVERKTLL